MDAPEIRDAAEVRRFLAQGLWLQRAATPRPATVAASLRRSLEMAGAGEPMPPSGVVADLGHLVLDLDRGRGLARELPDVPGWPDGLARVYEDLVLGKLDADASIARASDALARYSGRDRDRGLAFLVGRLLDRAGGGGVLVNPAGVKAALERPADELLAAGWESLSRDGPMPMLVRSYERLIAAVRDLHEAIGPEDVFELEHGTALAAFAQRVALRQVIQAAAEFEAGIPAARPRRVASRRDVATRLPDEDSYPVGGFSSISNRGSIESLLHSELAYMERHERPDLFDVRYARNELLYYSRDENQFHRRRRAFVIALCPDLAAARVKDVSLPRQRIVLLLAMLVAAVRRLSDWLSEEAITFDLLFLRPERGEAEPLGAERAVVEMVFREAIALGTVRVESAPAAAVPARCAEHARRAPCQALVVSAGGAEGATDGVPVAAMRVDGPSPRLEGADIPDDGADEQEPLDRWRSALGRLLAAWA